MLWAKQKRSPNRRTNIDKRIGEAYSYLRQKNTKALELVRRLGAFLFAARLFPSDSFRGGRELPADRRADR